MRNLRGKRKAMGRSGVCASPYLKSFVVITAVYGFIGLSIYSLNKVEQEHGYSAKDIKGIETIIEQANPSKKHVSRKLNDIERREQIMALYSIDEEYLNQEVILWKD